MILFYVTNTDSIINLSGVDLTLADDTYLLLVAGNNSLRGWGTAGANGGTINTDGTTAAALSVTIDDSSTWTLTGDSYITEFNSSMNNVDLNGYTLYVNGSAMAD